MGYKVLLADDSLTIQKVVKITLSTGPYIVEVCDTADELENKINEFKPQLVLLDFNLAEDRTGYDLGKLINETDSSIKTLALLGTFDSVDDDRLEESHIHEQIVKPFDGIKFISLCEKLLEDVEEVPEELSSSDATQKIYVDHEELFNFDEDFEEDFGGDIPAPIADEWTVQQPEIIEPVDEAEIEAEEDTASLNHLEKAAMDWGIEIPGIIGTSPGENDNALEIPGVISEEDIETSSSFIEEEFPNAISEPEEVVEEIGSRDAYELPDDDDLDYPNIEEVISKIEAEPVQDPLSFNQEPAATLSSIDEDDERGTELEEDIKDLEELISDEVDEDLWAVDDGGNFFDEPTAEDNPNQERHVIDEEDSNLFEYNEDEIEEPITLFEPQNSSPGRMPNINIRELEDNLFERLKPLIINEIRKACNESVEKVSWEVIPDLAENLIREEIEKISGEVLDSN